MSKEIEDLRTRVEEVEIKTATNQLGIKRLKNELTKSNKKIKLLDDKFTTCTELSRYHIKEKEKIPYVFLAPPRNRYFSGRKKEIEELKRILKVEETMNEEKVRVAAVCGLGGIGKTSLVSEYAYQMKDFYEGGVYWFSAENDAFLEKSVNDIALRIDAMLGSFDLTLSNFLKKINCLSDPTLFVLDCMDQPELSSNMMKLLSFLSQRSIFGHLVVITRRSPNRLVNDISFIEEDYCLRLECFQPEEAKEFLLSRTDIKSDAKARSVAESLCEELGRLPLALEQAGAYIKMLPRCSLSSYLEHYKIKRLQLLEEQPARFVSDNESRDRLAVHTTWLINIEHMKKSPNGAAAVRFMNACSFFNGNEIDEDLINVGTPEVEDVAYRECVSLPLGRYQILKLLTDFSLFTYVNNAQSISAHRLVLELVQERLDEKSKAETFSDAVRLLSFAFSKCSSPSNHAILDESDIEENISFSDPPNSLSHFYLWSKLCIHAYHLCRNMENLLKSADLDSTCFPETAKILYEYAIYLSANHKQEEAKRNSNFAYRLLDWTSLEGYEKIIENLSSDTLFPLPIPLPEIFQMVIKKYCKPSDSLQPLTDDFGSENTRFVVPEANVSAFEANDVGVEVVELALVASDPDLEKNVQKLELDGNKFLEEGSYKESLNTYSSAINLAQDCKHPFSPLLLANRASVYVALEQYEEALKDANEYIQRRPDCWMGYAWKALALDGINKKSRPELVDKASAEIAAALAFYRNERVFSGLPVFDKVFGRLKKRIFLCDSVDTLLNAIFSEENETGGWKILVLGSKEYIFDSNSLKDPWNNCILVGAGKNRSVSIKSDKNIDLLMCMLTNLSFSFNESQLHCLSGSFVKLLNCNFLLNGITNGLAAVKSEGMLSAEQCSFTRSNNGLLSTGSGKTRVIDCSVFNNTGNGLTAKNGGMLIVKNSRIFNNRVSGLHLDGAAPQCIVDNCYTHHNGANGIVVYKSSEVTVKSNKVFHNSLNGIEVSNSEVDVRENDIFDNSGVGIWADGNLPVTITMNNVSRNKHAGISVNEEDPQFFRIHRNKIYGNIGPGLVNRFSPEEHSSQSQDNEIYNNKEIGKLNLSIPYCSNCRKSCELRKCEKCFTAAYCSESCQESQWSRHKKICNVLREKLSYLVTSYETAEYSKETVGFEEVKDVGLQFCPPPPRDGKVFVAKVHIADADPRSCTVILFDRSLELNVKFDSKSIYQLLKEFGELCDLPTHMKRLFFHCFFNNDGKIRLFTNEFAEFADW